MVKLEHSHFAQICAISPQAFGLSYPEVQSSSPAFEQVGNVAIVRVSGPICYAANPCFLTYGDILSRIKLAANSDCEWVLVHFDSPGGDVFGAFDASRAIRALSLATGKRIVAYADSKICSAAFALAVGCSDIVISESAVVGSIGVISMMADRSAQNAALGLKFYAVTSGERKADGNPELAISEESLAATQKLVDIQAQLFFNLCSEMRGNSPEHYQSLQAGEFVGADAVKVGLASAILPYDALLSAKESIPMKEDYEKAIAALKAVADGDGDEETKNKAKKALAAATDEEKDPKAEESEEKDPKAEDSEEDNPKALAAKAIKTSLRALAEVHTLRAEKASDKESAEREQLIASRKDFDPDLRAILASADIATVRKMCTELKKGPDYVAPVTAAVSAAGVVPPAINEKPTPTARKAQIDAAMGLQAITPGVITKGEKVYFSLTGNIN